MHQHACTANIICMEFFDLEVVYLNGHSQFLMLNSIYICVFSILQLYLIVSFKLLRRNPTPAMYIERMLSHAGN